MWEIRNEDVHGKTTSEQTSKLIQRQKHIIANLIELKNKCLARDHYIFPRNVESLLREKSTTKLANWIASRTQAIKNSIKQALQQDLQNTSPITKWFKPPETNQLTQDVQWHRDRLLHDPYNKKKRHKQKSGQDEQCNPTTHQTTMTQYF